jgi:Isocitrate lyase
MIDLTYEERIRREADNLRTHWSSSPRWEGIERPFEAEDVIPSAARSRSSTPWRGSAPSGCGG